MAGVAGVAVAAGAAAIARPLTARPLTARPSVMNPDTNRICLFATRFRLITRMASVTGAWQAVDSGEMRRVGLWTLRL